MKAIYGTPGRRVGTMLAALMLTLTTPLLALQESSQQESQQQASPGEQSQQTARFDESKLEAVAKAYVKVAKIEESYKPRIDRARSDEEKKRLEQEAMREMAKAIEDQEGVSVEEYNEIMTAAQTDDQLRQQLAAKVDEAQREINGNQTTEE